MFPLYPQSDWFPCVLLIQEASWQKQIPFLMLTLEHSLPPSKNINWTVPWSQGGRDLDLLDIKQDKDGPHESTRVCINRELQGAVEFKEVQSKLMDNINICLERNAKYDQSRHNVKSLASNKEKWHTVYMILKSSSVFSCGSNEYSKLRAKIEEMACADRLPHNNTLQALVLLRYAWTLSDLFDAQSRLSKLLGASIALQNSYFSTALAYIFTVHIVASNGYSYLDPPNDAKIGIDIHFQMFLGVVIPKLTACWLFQVQKVGGLSPWFKSEKLFS